MLQVGTTLSCLRVFYTPDAMPLFRCYADATLAPDDAIRYDADVERHHAHGQLISYAI